MYKQKFALVGHPPDIDLLRKYIDHLKPGNTFKNELLLKLFEWTPSYKIKEWQKYTLDNKNYVDGIMVMVPFLPEMKDIKLAEVTQKIEQAIAISKDNGCTIVSLGAFNSIILQGQEEAISKKYNIRLTSGNALTAAIIVKSIEELTQKFNINLKQTTMAIIGASGDIGSGVLSYFCDKVKKLNLTARNLDNLNKVVEQRKKYIKCEVAALTENIKAIRESKIIIFTSSAYNRLFSVDDFPPGTIICDASAPLNVAYKEEPRKDLFLYAGGIASLQKEIDVGFDIGLASTYSMYGCMTEGILLACKLDLPCSWGRGNITREKIGLFLNEIAKNSPISPALSVGSHIYTEEEFKEYKNILKN